MPSYPRGSPSRGPVRASPSQVPTSLATGKIAPSTYYAHKKRLQTPSARRMRDEELKERISRTSTRSTTVSKKIWRELNRQGHAVARCTVERA
ncbi:hypothetical protein BJY54_006974 [Streptomyces nodosus]|nr:hypothetical protein [Streptomyces nodosus]